MYYFFLPLDDLVKHSYAVNQNENEMPSAEITKNLVAKFQQGGDPSPPASSSPPVKPGKLADRVSFGS